jgi:hypothetical protein
MVSLYLKCNEQIERISDEFYRVSDNDLHYVVCMLRCGRVDLIGTVQDKGL